MELPYVSQYISPPKVYAQNTITDTDEQTKEGEVKILVQCYPKGKAGATYQRVLQTSFGHRCLSEE